jgi:hypothetical protein
LFAEELLPTAFYFGDDEESDWHKRSLIA